MNDYVEKENFDPEVVNQIGRIDLIAKYIVDGMKRGAHRSRSKGFTTEFSDFKPYVSGDDPRLLDWRVYARTERLYIKRYEAEANLELMLLLDATASMAWRWENNISKLEYAANLMAALAALHIRSNDDVGLLTCDQDEIHHLPPRSRMSHLTNMFAILEDLKPGHAQSFPLLLKSLSELRHHKGRITICSDLEEDEDEIESALSRMSGIRDEIILFHILDKSEIELPFKDITHLEDAESGERVAVNLPKLKLEHKRKVTEFRQRWEQSCKDWGIIYIPIDTATPYPDAIYRMIDAQIRSYH